MTNWLLNEPAVLGVQTPRIISTQRRPGMESAGPEVAELIEPCGFFLDPWQQLATDEILLEERPGKWCHNEVGLCVCRQNGKGSILEAIELADLFLLDTEVTIHSAHLFDTSLDAFRRIMVHIESNPDMDRLVRRVSNTNGKEGIEVFRDGKPRFLKFKARTKGGGRGLGGDRVVIDEAMYYTADQDAALRPTLSARRDPQIILTGSAGWKESVQFGRLRHAALNGGAAHMCWLEWSVNACTDMCPKGCTDHDPVGLEQGEERFMASLARANPGLGIRLTRAWIETERRSMDPDKFATERLGVGDWPVEGDAWRVIPEEPWRDRHDPVSAPMSPLAFAVDVTPDRRYASITVAGMNGEGSAHVEITGSGQVPDYRPYGRWIVPRLQELNKLHKPAYIVVDRSQWTGELVDELEALKLPVLSPSLREYAQACGAFYSAVCPRRGERATLVHLDQAPLTAAVAGAEKRSVGDLWAWDKRSATVDISPLVAATLACWGLSKAVNKPKARPKAAWG